MIDGYLYEQFGVWWVFLEEDRVGRIQLNGPYRTRARAEEALASIRGIVPVPTET